MGIRIAPFGLAVLIFSLALFNSLQGLAGPLSRLMVLFPLCIVGSSLIQVWYSYMFFSFHQEFSTDHPVRGEELQYSFVVQYQGIMPTCGIVCQFAFKGPGLKGGREHSVFLMGKNNKTWSFTFRCAYRGVYAVGVERILFKDSLGLFQFSYEAEPRMFYVYPELLPLPHTVESFLIGSGDAALRSEGFQEDVGVFDSIYPLRHGEGSRQIAWKRFAATGIPSAYRIARSAAPALRVVLDLRPPPFINVEENRLLAEDLAVSLVFSVLRYMADRGIPTDFYCGSEAAAVAISDNSTFQELYTTSTSILFNHCSCPEAAWIGDTATLLVSLQVPLDPERTTGLDLYAALEHRLRRGYRMLLITVPGPSLVEGVQKRTADLLEQLPPNYTWIPCKVLDTRQGNEGITHVFE